MQNFFSWRRLTRNLSAIAALVSIVIGVLTLLGYIFPPQTETAVRVQECERTHHLTAATVQQNPSEDITMFATCHWPPPSGAEPDGYTAVTSQLVSIPGGSPPTNDVWVRRITGPCAQFGLEFTHGHMGNMIRLPLIMLYPNSVVQIAYATPAPYDRSKLPFYPARGEVDVVHNEYLDLDHADCIR